MLKKIKTPLDAKAVSSLKAGEEVLLSGVIYTARDQAHARLDQIIKNGDRLPLDLEGQVIYYCGPTPPGKRVIGACGPTTSGRMDAFTPVLLEHGAKGFIGKGRRSEEVANALREFKGIYLLAPGGAGALLSGKVKKCDIIAFEDLGPEAIYRLEVEDFPLVVGIDSAGRDVYERLKR